MKRTALVIAVLALLAAGCGSGEESAGGGTSPAATRADAASLKGSPAPLAALHEQAGELLGGGADAFKARLAKLKGYPVVVNKWASWCPPCRAEFPFFRAQGLARGKKVAFVGVDSSDSDGDAKEFLKSHPVPYPSYTDPDLEVARVFKGTLAFPSTAFYDSKGELAYLKQGGYASEQKLVEDIDRYAR